MSKDKIIVVRGYNQDSTQLRVSGVNGAVTDIHGNECLVSEYQLYDWLHTASCVSYEWR